MKHVTIPLSEAHRTFVEEQVARGDFADIADYLANLIAAEVAGRERARERLDALLLEGLEGPPAAWTSDDADTLRRLASGIA